MKQIEKFFDFETEFARKHKLNTCNRRVPQEFLDKIEDGCSIENLEEMMQKRFDVFKYKTQITIHGIFPELSTRRVGGYINLVQNQNKSVGVRYSAIDFDKKSRLYNMLSRLKLWNVERNSQTFGIYKTKRLPDNWKENREEILSIVRSYENEAKNIDRKLFVGNVCCNLVQGLWGDVYVMLSVNIQCFYERNFKALFENLSGMNFEEGERKVAEIIEKETREREERNRQYEIEAAKRREEEAKKKAELIERKKAFINANPLQGFSLRENHLPHHGEILGYVHYDRYGDKFVWRFRKIKIAFGKINATPCNENGEKIRDWEQKGKVIDAPIGKIYVKDAA